MKYFFVTLKHKWFVFLAGIKIGVPLWLLLVHDWSKFLSSELPHYNRQFFGDKGDPDGFAVAWLYHQNRHPHHPEFWITRHKHSHSEDVSVDECLPMPRVYVKEMITDWMGASMAYTGKWNMSAWLKKELPKKRLHPRTRIIVYEMLRGLGYEMAYLEGVIE